MRKNVLYFLMVICSCLIFMACDKTEKSSDLNKDENVEDLLSNDSSKVSLGSFSYGVTDKNYNELHENQVYEFNGEEVRIPYKVTGEDEKIESEFGLKVFVDGISQPFKIEKEDGSISDESYMKNFSLAYNETKNFDIVFTPISGHEGEKIGIYISNVLKPNFIPTDEKKPTYGMYHSLSGIIPQEISINSEIQRSTTKKALTKPKEEEISQEIKDEIASFKGGEIDEYLDTQTITELLPLKNDEDKNILNAKNGKVKFQYRIYGGPEALYRTEIFVNHKPVKFKEMDYIETTVKKGKMYTAEVELDTTSYDKFSTVYAIATPAGDSYLKDYVGQRETDSILLVNE